MNDHPVGTVKGNPMGVRHVAGGGGGSRKGQRVGGCRQSLGVEDYHVGRGITVQTMHPNFVTSGDYNRSPWRMLVS